ncbi:helix-turn-helix domain-containing protein [Streptomyces salinarius]|uniref:helix-turn-helix domain-containing protein n=1 Tax=Streptomyces salinarius TaxID=2762598 RepID=UPI001646DBA2|nr:helix-turn-helix domain-containing protein [Streptomyces salinarius]
MGRPEKPIESYGCAAGGFSCLLRGARERAGSPTYREMEAADSCRVSYSQLSKAASGNAMPSWAVAESFLSSVNELRTQGEAEDLGMWYARWAKAMEREDTERALPPRRRRRARHARPNEPVIVPVAADPTRAGTVEEFICQMKILHAWSGLTLSQISTRAKIPTSTLSDTLRRSTLPKLPFVEAFVRACGGRRADVKPWREAWRHIKVSELVAGTTTSSAGVRRVEKALNVGPDAASEEVAETVAYLRKADVASVPRPRPEWLQDAVEGKPDDELKVLLTGRSGDRSGMRGRSGRRFRSARFLDESDDYESPAG